LGFLSGFQGVFAKKRSLTGFKIGALLIDLADFSEQEKYIDSNL